MFDKAMFDNLLINDYFNYDDPENFKKIRHRDLKDKIAAYRVGYGYIPRGLNDMRNAINEQTINQWGKR